MSGLRRSVDRRHSTSSMSESEISVNGRGTELHASAIIEIELGQEKELPNGFEVA